MSDSSDGHRRWVSGRVVLALWALAVALSAVGLGRFIDESVTGIVFEQRSVMGAVLTVMAAIGALVVTIFWARGLGRSERSPAKRSGETGRRRFLIGAAGAAGGLVATGIAAFVRPRGWLMVTGPAIGPDVETSDPNPNPAWRGARVQSYRRLGRTGFRVSDISLGSTRIKGEVGETVAREAIERGVNYFDTAPDYSETGSELALGRAMKGYRERMFVATKFCTPTGHLQAGSPVRQYMEVVEASLKRLQTDYVDLVHVHACNSIDRLLDPNVHEAFLRLKEQGKARFLGFSSHAPNLDVVADAAIEDGRFDAMMLAYHHGAWPKLKALIDRAAQADMGMVAMKTLKGAKQRGLSEFRPQADSYAQAAFKWVLGNPSVSCLVISFSKLSDIDEYLYASGKRLEEADLDNLRRYDELAAGKHCFQHCGECLDSCPERLAVDDVLRFRMYFEDYGEEREAMRLYAALDKRAGVCAGCNAPCAGACPYGVSIQERMIGAHEMLHFG